LKRSIFLLLLGLLATRAVAQETPSAPTQDRNKPFVSRSGSSKGDPDGDEGEALDREKFERSQFRYSTVAPAEAGLSAWIRLQRVPFWRDAEGAVPAWEELGPRVLLHGWGDMENAGRTSSVLVDRTDSRIVYAAAASGGLWKSTDGCTTWQPIADREPSLCFGALAMDPFDHRTIYAGTGEAHYSLDSFSGIGIMRSQDGGASWELLGSDVFIGQRFARIVPNPDRPGFIYAAATGGVYRSTDAGGSWVKLLDGPASDILVNPENPSALIACVGLPGGKAENGLYKSVDSGDHWEKLSSGLPREGRRLGRIQMDFCHSYPQVVYASFYRSAGGIEGIYKTTDFGRNWVRLPAAPDYAGGQSWYDNYLSVNPVNPNVVFVGGTSTYRTIDGGVTWQDNTRSYADGPIHPDHHFLAFDPQKPRTAYLCTDGGVFRTEDLGESWSSVCRGLGTVQFQFLDVHPTDKNIAYGGTQDNGSNKYVGSWDWEHVFTGDGGVTRVNWVNPDVVYTEYVDLTICKSTDAGANWQWDVTKGINRGEGALFYAPFNLDPSNPDVLVAGTRRVYRSTDAAENWTPISDFLGARVSAITIAPNNPAVIYAGTSDGRVWVTASTGHEWYEVTKGMTQGYVNDICIDPRNARHVFVAQNGWGGNKLWESTDAGGTWKPIGAGLPEVPIRGIVLHPRDPDTLFIGTEVGAFISTDGGKRWYRFGKGLPNAPVFSIVANAKTGFVTVGTHGRGAWRIPLP
jgi:photosystem II stability/assembly factor-like uncharacterized protein